MGMRLTKATVTEVSYVDQESNKCQKENKINKQIKYEVLDIRALKTMIKMLDFTLNRERSHWRSLSLMFAYF